MPFSNKKNNLKVIVVGVGHMGAAHGRSYNNPDGFELTGLVAATAKQRN